MWVQGGIGLHTAAAAILEATGVVVRRAGVLRVMEQFSPFNRLLGIHGESVAAGRGVLILPVRPEFVGDPRRPALHGGVLSALIDTAGGLAAAVFLGLPTGLGTIFGALAIFALATRIGVGLVSHLLAAEERAGRRLEASELAAECSARLVPALVQQMGETYQELGKNVPIPLVHEIKFNASYDAPFGIQIGTTLISYAGSQSPISWVVPTNLFAPVGGRTATVTLPLQAPGVDYLPRWGEFDLSFKKSFNFGERKSLTAMLDIFNVPNSSTVLTEQQNLGATLGYPTSTIQGRLFKVGGRFRF